MNEKSVNKSIVIVILVASLIVALLLTLWGENYVMLNPTPIEPVVMVDDEGNEVIPEAVIGSTNDEPVIFSLETGFYSSAETLYLSAPDAVEIRYSDDGDDPRDSGRLYKGEIKFKVPKEEGVKLYSISACAKYADGTYSDVVTRSYFVGSEIAERYDCLVFSITIDPDYLYNYEDGIFILGKMRDDWLAANPDVKKEDIVPTDPANWNQRGHASERPAYVEVFEYDGECVISQDCGLRIFGGWSRANDQKNLRLYARTEYDEVDNRFRYEFFPDALDSNGDKITSYKKIALRACANDNGYLFFRDDMNSHLAMATEVEAKYSRPAAVYLNGEYYGFAWCQQVFSTDLLEHKYNIEESEWDILKGCEYMIRDDADNPYLEEAKADWEYLQSFAYKDLTDNATYEELCSMLDVDNFLTYYAINSYIGNGDWPNNNWKIFRYSDRNDESLIWQYSEEAQDICDGRWRFMLFDTDFAMGLYNSDAFERHIYQLLDEEYFGLFPKDWDDDVHDDGEKYKRSDLLISLCKREDVKERFVSIVCDMANWFYSEMRVHEAIDEFGELRLHELSEAMKAGKAHSWNLNGELQNAREWIEVRTLSFQSQITKAFPEFEETFLISAKPTEGATIKINLCEITPDEMNFKGRYFIGLDIPITCELEQGWEFVSWELGDKEIFDMSFTVDGTELENVTKLKLNVKCVDSAIKIEKVCYKGSNSDFVVIKNYGVELLSTQGMYIWDGSADEAFALPTATLEPGESLKLICKNYSRSDAIGCVEIPFNLKEYETVYLLDENGETLESLFLRDGTDGSALVRDNFTGEYYEESVYPKERILEAELPSWGHGWGW